MMAALHSSHHYESLIQRIGAYDSMCGCGVCRNRRTPFLCLFFSFPTAMESFSRTALHKTACATVECIENTPPQCNVLFPLDSDKIILNNLRRYRMFRWTPCRSWAINTTYPFFLWTVQKSKPATNALCALLVTSQKHTICGRAFPSSGRSEIQKSGCSVHARYESLFKSTLRVWLCPSSPGFSSYCFQVPAIMAMRVCGFPAKICTVLTHVFPSWTLESSTPDQITHGICIAVNPLSDPLRSCRMSLVFLGS
jgi:hypothetical protein